MKNKQVGYLISGIAVVIAIIIFIFNNALKNIVAQTCTHGPSCSMYGTISTQTDISLAIAGLVFLIGLFFVFAKEPERIVIKKIKEHKKKLDLTGLDNYERKTIDLLQSENGTMFQASLMEKLGIGKVGITRLLDKLEAKQLIERKRRGMNNVVVLRD
ncbi:MAG: hypothetical protein Q7S33_00260 [Nanoarchaeota archaeon]|nr:hypothetical protein [Nanoarchaeota archaeon]